MSDDDALGADMRLLLGSLEPAPPVAGQDMLERLLDGRLEPASAPPGYGGLARLQAAATAPAAPEELAGEQLAMAEFAAVMRSHPSTLVPRRAAVASKVFTMKAAAAVLVAVLSIGGVAAATGLLPGQASPVADQAPTTTGAGAAGQGLGAAAGVELGETTRVGWCRAWRAGKDGDGGSRADTPEFQALASAAGGAGNVAGFCNDATVGGSADGQGRGSAVGPDAKAAARAGLCRAWQSGKGADSGRRADSVAFQALVDAAGGADKVAGYCKDVIAGGGAGARGQRSGSPPTGVTSPAVAPPSTVVSPPGSGPPTNPGHGQGEPPTSTG